jgi:NADH-quinone oxidoreductase subunit M
MTENILSWITFIPLIGMAAVLCVPRQNVALVKTLSLVATGIPLLLATWLYFGLYEKGDGALQFIERVTWIDGIKAEYFVGIDGLSLPLLWLTTLLLFIGVPASFGIQKAHKAYYALLLLLEVGILGVFIFKSLAIKTMGPRLVSAKMKRMNPPVGFQSRLSAKYDTSSRTP